MNPEKIKQKALGKNDEQSFEKKVASKLADALDKRTYIADPSEAPDDVNVEEGERGGYYYEVDSDSGASNSSDPVEEANANAPDSVGDRGFGPEWMESEPGSDERSEMVAEEIFSEFSIEDHIEEMRDTDPRPVVEASVEGAFDDISEEDKEAAIEEMSSYIESRIDDMDDREMEQNFPDMD